MRRLYHSGGYVTRLGDKFWHESAAKLADHIADIRKRAGCSMAEAIMLTLDTVPAGAQQALNREQMRKLKRK